MAASREELIIESARAIVVAWLGNNQYPGTAENVAPQLGNMFKKVAAAVKEAYENA